MSWKTYGDIDDHKTPQCFYSLHLRDRYGYLQYIRRHPNYRMQF